MLAQMESPPAYNGVTVGRLECLPYAE